MRGRASRWRELDLTEKARGEAAKAYVQELGVALDRLPEEKVTLWSEATRAASELAREPREGLGALGRALVGAVTEGKSRSLKVCGLEGRRLRDWDGLCYTTGSILESVSQGFTMAHQCSCTTKAPKGLAAEVFRRFPVANTYGGPRCLVPGTVDVFVVRDGWSGKEGKVVNLYAQRHKGHAGKDGDRPEDRVFWFKQCLDWMHVLLPKDEWVVFPHRVGCGRAGGSWAAYREILAAFARREQSRRVMIVCGGVERS